MSDEEFYKISHTHINKSVYQIPAFKSIGFSVAIGQVCAVLTSIDDISRAQIHKMGQYGFLYDKK